MDTENPSNKPSSLRQPTKLPQLNAMTAPTTGLHEITDSQSNSRAYQSQLQPPKEGLKRALPPPASYPEPKRKPLSERAATEGFSGRQNVTESSAPMRALKSAGQSIQQMAKAGSISASRQTSSTSNSSYATSTTRTTSGNSYGSSVGPGARPPSRHGATKSLSRSVHGKPTGIRGVRPATAMGSRNAEEDEGKNAWDYAERMNTFESEFKAMKNLVTELQDGTVAQKQTLEDEVKKVEASLKQAETKATDLEQSRNDLQYRNTQLQHELDNARREVQAADELAERERRTHQYDLEDRQRDHRREVDDVRKELADETDRLKKEHREALEALERHYRVELEDERNTKTREVDALRTKLGHEQQDLHLDLLKKDREIQDMRTQADDLQTELEREKNSKRALENTLAELSTTVTALEAKVVSLRSQIDFLQSDNQAQSKSFENMEARLQGALATAEECKAKLIKEETERRVLFNKYQELKGNIRVMCRVRPVLDPAAEGDAAQISYPDEKSSAEIDIRGPEEKSSMGVVSRKHHPFEFDRVFGPGVLNEEVFDEISQLVQSALDGYNVCIFCYGQTGSGKTHTMSSADGMIPRATHMIYDTVSKLKEKSWSYTMEGSFIEVYNEELHDLLTPQKDQKKLNIQHDESRKQTNVIGCQRVVLDNPDKVETMLNQAQNNRSVAATKSNERSSRSHSVFILKLVGENSATGERCEGTLNLVDLAGSERLKQSGAEGDRMKETQNINKSLSCLGDVIEALGRGAGHIPYRNSKLTHLLQYSLGGNSKTLMFVMVSPLELHLRETLTSLKFATKVHNTHIGTAKATKKIKGES